MELAKKLGAWLAEEINLGAKELDPDAPLAELGLNSTTVYRLAAKLSAELGLDVSPTFFFKYPSLRTLSNALEARLSGQLHETGTKALSEQSAGLEGSVYVVGMACRFPGASNVRELEQLLKGGRCSVRDLPPGRAELCPALDAAAKQAKTPGFWKAGYLEDVDLFDPKAFRISPKEAPEMDPQQRLLLLSCREALEDAGLLQELAAHGERVGVFIGASSSDYALLAHQASNGSPSPYFGTGNAHSVLAGRLSYLFGWNGPSMAVDTACSSSLVALHLARQSLLSGECDVAIVGGVNLILDPTQTQVFAKAGMLSPDGLCKTFDSRANGYVRGEGVGVVVLTKASQVSRYSLDPYAAVCGTAVNQDGRSNGLTAPHGPSQVAVIQSALANAKLSSEQVVAVEAHGTGTGLGDPIEWESLKQVYGQGESGPCYVSSVKTNFGHLESAAGIAGLMRLCLSIKSRFVPRHLHFESPLPMIKKMGDDSRLRVSKAGLELASDDPFAPLYMGVSSFGFGGTNAHAIVRNTPEFSESDASDEESQRLSFIPFVPVSGASPETVAALSESLKARLEQGESALLDAAASSLYFGRAHGPVRGALLPSKAEAGSLRVSPFGEVVSGSDLLKVALFTGQGSQRPGMGYELYESCDSVRDFMNDCDLLLEEELGASILDVMFDESESSPIHETRWTQPALFVFEAAQYEYWRSQGFEPDLVLGHSVGELVAAYAAGILSLEDAVRLVARRAQAMQNATPGGRMIAVLAAPDELKEELKAFGTALSLGAWNAARSCVVSGDAQAVTDFCEVLGRRSIKWKMLQVSHAFHSEHMRPASENLLEAISSLSFHQPKIPILSNLSGQLDRGEMASPDYWCRQILAPTLFYPNVQCVIEQARASGQDRRIFALEFGPTPHLSSFLKSILPKGLSIEASAVVMGVSPKGQSETMGMTQVAAALWCHTGQLLKSGDFFSSAHRRIHLPSTPFSLAPYWLRSSGSVSGARKEHVAESSGGAGREASRGAMASHQNGKNTDSRPSQGALTMSREISAQEAKLKSIQKTVLGIVCEALGLPEEQVNPNVSLLEVGADSLLLVEAVRSLEETYGLEFAMSDLFGDLSSVSALSQHILANATIGPSSEHIEAEGIEAQVERPSPIPSEPGGNSGAQAEFVNFRRESSSDLGTSAPLSLEAQAYELRDESQPQASKDAVQGLFQSQLAIMEKQLDILRNMGRVAAAPSQTGEPKTTATSKEALDRSIQLVHWNAPVDSSSKAVLPAKPKAAKSQEATQATGAEDRFSAMMPKLSTTAGDPNLATYLEAFIPRFVAKTQSSRNQAQDYRLPLAENRNASGFRMHLKELCYPIVAASSKGSRVWDVDGNEYIDMTMGFGVNLYGHSDPDITKAVMAQLDKGIHVGPQSDLAGRVAKAFCELTGKERVAFTNSGTEAVMTAIRLARAVTGRDRIVIFSHSYHGTFDGVLARASRSSTKGEPVTKGIAPSLVSDVDVLDYGSLSALDFIRENGESLACVLVEPVQSRRPGLQPVEFLKELRRLTEESKCALIFDEVITGLRTGPQGAQGHFGVEADLATYGKVLGGGMPIGAVAGSADFLDPIDGGFWQYGDGSYPQKDLTFFAGTFCKHPLAMAAAEAVLQKIAQDPRVCKRLTERTASLCERLNGFFESEGFPLKLDHFGSLFRFSFTGNLDVFFYELVYRGIYVWEGRNLFLSESHTDEDIERFERTVKEVLFDLAKSGVLKKKILSEASSDSQKRADSEKSYDSEKGPSSAIPLTLSQERFLELQQGDGKGGLASEISLALEIKDPIKADLLQEAVEALPSRHAALRLSFDPQSKEQQVTDTGRLAFQHIQVARGDEITSLLSSLSQTVLGITSESPLARFTLISDEGARRQWLHLQASHLAMDGVGVALLLEDLAKTGSLASDETLDAQQALRASDGAYRLAFELSRERECAVDEEALDSLSERIISQGRVVCLHNQALLPSGERHLEGQRRRLLLEGHVWQNFRAALSRRKMSLFQGLALCYGQALQLACDSGAEVAHLLIPVAGRDVKASQRVVGNFVNLVPLSVGTAASHEAGVSSLKTLFSEGNLAELRDFYTRHSLPFLKIRSRLREKGLQKSPFCSTFNLEPSFASGRFLGSEVGWHPMDIHTSEFPLMCNVIAEKERAWVELDFQMAALEPEQIEAILSSLQDLVSSVV